jgi:prepilin-type N-terminal cleavage/methylation domain-containing protein
MRSQRGFTLIELLVVVAIIGLLAAMGIAQVVRARSAANQSSAVGSLRAIVSSEISYANACGGGNYATTLPTLAIPAPGGNIPFLSPDLTTGVIVMKSGYSIVVGPGAAAVPGPNDCNGTGTATEFYASAEPVDFGRTGDRSFATTGAGTIWTVSAAVAPPEPFGAPAEPIQ